MSSEILGSRGVGERERERERERDRERQGERERERGRLLLEKSRCPVDWPGDIRHQSPCPLKGAALVSEQNSKARR